MALYRQGDTGEAIRDIQERLAGLGYGCEPDAPGEFGPATLAAVCAFQDSRSLTPDGLVGSETWRTLVDAGFRLGDRILYYRLPMLHGEDVAELQRELNALGFDAGNVDGIFGAETLRALLDFQQNRRLAEDGIAGPLVLSELGLMVRATRKMGRDTVRERVWLRSLPPTVAGQRIMLDPFCRDDLEAELSWDAAGAASQTLRDLGAIPVLSRSRDTRPTERNRARQANQIAADLIVGFALPQTDSPGIFYFASTHSRSEAGHDVAGFVARRLGLEAVGRTMPILRETRATAIVVAAPRLDPPLGRAVARGLEAWLSAAAERDQPDSDR